ncbi:MULTISPECIES: gamma-glutamylcyclotransferase [Thalassospira]|uniref:Gamma-glutamyl cyclotransferase n=2 Tax=Thalassospira TaxID=168934 RepID=A0A367W4G2_9PROT|nr:MULTISPECIES: gamma-glutamylcyclotransferase [Thalassospira]MDG4719623.1 hypothetical protein [Thalassospira sp. FZY0004]RCK36336.1 gamma-glutamyl cyclotransferase [Thalassospira profundimaris]
MHYFGYCTWLDDAELRRFMPNAKMVTKGYAANHRLEFHAAADRTDRGWCHLADTRDAWGNNALGVIFEHEGHHFKDEYDDFERCFLTAYGDDGKMYECWTYRLITPGIPMRPPHFYWNHIPKGMKEWGFPEEYIQQTLKMYDEAAECPDADRPNPSAIPGKSAASR